MITSHLFNARTTRHKFRTIPWLIAFSFIVGCSDTVETAVRTQDFLSMRVTRVVDGDSIEAVTHKNQKVEIRLYGIDAPERNQPFAQQAKKHTQRLLENKSIQVVGHEIDRYDRLIATVYLEGAKPSINEQLIDQGAVWVYRQYAKDPAWLALEDKARASQRGLWALPAAQRIPPWQWRKDQQH